MSRKSLRRKSAKRKLRNIVWLVSLLAIVVGIYFNIYNSRAEEVIKIGASVLDNYGYLENEKIELEAKHIGDDLYEIELPKSINTKKIFEFVEITLQDLLTEPESEQEKTQTQEEIEEITVEDTNEIVEDTNESEQEISENAKIEIADNKIQLTKEQLENQKLNLEVKYDMLLLEKLEDGSYKKESLSTKTEEDIKALAEAEMLYSKILKYEDEQNGKQVELKGYLPKDAELKVEGVTQEKLTEVFGEAKIDVAYDIKILVKEAKQVLMDENNPEGEVQEVVEYKEINPEEFGEQCQVSIKDSSIAQDSQVYHVKEDNTFEHVKVKQNDEESISFEAQTFSIYAITADKSVMVASGSDITPPEIIIGTKKDVVTAATLTVEDYGGYVTNYTPINGINDEGVQWRIFHSDGGNVYLIADAYIPILGEGNKKYIPVESGMELEESSITLPVTYNGGSDIEPEIAAKLLTQYTAAGMTNTNSKNNGKATAYLLDADSWFGFRDNKYAEYAVGSPTLDLFRASYNAKYPSRTILTRPDSRGYNVSWSDGEYGNTCSLTGIENDELYITNTDAYYPMWLASPSSYGDDHMMVTGFGDVSGIIASHMYNDTGKGGIRPIIVLKSDTKLEKLGNNQYQLTDAEAINGNSEWKKEHNETITIVDKESGMTTDINGSLTDDIGILYAWSKSKTEIPESWNLLDKSEGFFEDEQTYKVDISKAEMPTTSGKYYLWIKPDYIIDNSGNEATQEIVSNQPYYFDVTTPTVQFGNIINASTLTTEDYGGYVTNYTPTNGSSIGWRIFHSDSENIYLIADTYAPLEDMNPFYQETSGDYGFAIPYEAMDSMLDINSSIASKWLSEYTLAGYTAKNAEMNGRATAVLLATSWWDVFADGKYADYAVGAPTIELFVASYNATHPDAKIKIQPEPIGYNVALESQEFDYHNTMVTIDSSEDLYVISDTFNDTVIGMWIASPSGYVDESIWHVGNAGTIETPGVDSSNMGSRPIICLNSNVKLNKKSNGTYEIIESAESGNTTWSKSHTETISIVDEESGIYNNNTYLKYAWSTSNTIRPNEWEYATVSTNSDKRLTYEITTAGLTGKYYLWVGAEQLKDNAGNLEDGDSNSWAGEIVSKPYYFDNTAPQISIESTDAFTAKTLGTNHYGGYVTNYTPTNGVNDEGVKWRIFHSDGSNIYLIADSYVPLTNEAGTKNYVPTGYTETTGNYGFNLMAYTNYNGTSDIASNIASKWLSKYTEAGYIATNTGERGKAIAYLLDTNAWSGFKDSTYADYVVGAPTLELFTASYNRMHKSNPIEIQVDGELGYAFKWQDGDEFGSYIEGLDTSLGLYVLNESKAEGMWIATPCAIEGYGPMETTYVRRYRIFALS